MKVVFYIKYKKTHVQCHDRDLYVYCFDQKRNVKHAWLIQHNPGTPKTKGPAGNYHNQNLKFVMKYYVFGKSI